MRVKSHLCTAADGKGGPDLSPGEGLAELHLCMWLSNVIFFFFMAEHWVNAVILQLWKLSELLFKAGESKGSQ